MNLATWVTAQEAASGWVKSQQVAVFQSWVMSSNSACKAPAPVTHKAGGPYIRDCVVSAAAGTSVDLRIITLWGLLSVTLESARGSTYMEGAYAWRLVLWLLQSVANCVILGLAEEGGPSRKLP